MKSYHFLIMFIFKHMSTVSASQLDPLDTWLPVMESFSYTQMTNGIGIQPSACCHASSGSCSTLSGTCDVYAPSTLSGIPGAIQAATPYNNVDYYYSWTRDSALVMSTIVRKYELATLLADQQNYAAKLKNYVSFSQTAQVNSQSASAGLGEPKINFDGTVWTQGWCRPQNDGPALRAMTMIRFAKRYNTLNSDTYVSDNMFNVGNICGKNVIKNDLDYLVTHWNNYDCEPWEEVTGKHFYNRLAARRALLDGAAFATSMGDSTDSTTYSNTATTIGTQINTDHWNTAIDRIVPSTSLSNYADYTNKKPDSLDVQILLASLHSYEPGSTDNYYAPWSDTVLSSTVLLVRMFSNLYNLNIINYASWNSSIPALGVAIGRYHNDVYNGNGAGGGQPWFLATNAVAEVLYRTSKYFTTAGSITITSANVQPFTYIAGNQYNFAVGNVLSSTNNKNAYQSIITNLLQMADAQLKVTEFYCQNPLPGIDPKTTNNHLSEQFSADTGNQQSAKDLTWSYASMLTSKWSRDNANPVATISGFTPSGNVNVNFIIFNVPQNGYDTYITGDIAALGNWKPCSAVKASTRVTKYDGRSIVSAIVTIPTNTAFTWKPVMTPTGLCSGTQTWLGGSNLAYTTGTTNALNPIISIWDRTLGLCSSVPVTFTVTNYGNFGTMYVAGSDFTIGTWNLQNAIPMQWSSSSSSWMVTVPMPCNYANINWKPVHLNSGAPNSNPSWTWACGGNGIFTTVTTAVPSSYRWC